MAVWYYFYENLPSFNHFNKLSWGEFLATSSLHSQTPSIMLYS